MSAARRSTDPEVRRVANRLWRQKHKGQRKRSLRRKVAKKRAKKQWYQKNKSTFLAEMRRRRLQDKFDLTEQEYDRMFTEQGGHCAICPDGPLPTRRLAVDHCHKTNRVRGLLCARCNLGLGLFRDDESLLLSAIGYLQ